MADPAELRAAGWSSAAVGGFTAQLGPVWVRGGPREIGFIAAEHHGNTHLGTVHGGALMTFADIALGYGAVEAQGNTHCATAQLQLQFIASPKIGDFISCRPELVRRGSSLIFVRGLICVGERIVASADGIWKVLERHQP